MKGKALALSMAALLSLSSLSFATTSQMNKEASLGNVVNQPNWLNQEQLLVKAETETGFEYYRLGMNGEKKLLLAASVNATEVTESSDGKRLAYVNDNGELFILDLSSMAIKKVSVDNEPKMELQFSADNSKLYYLMGEKIDQIAMMDLGTEKQTILLGDKVSYKSDLQISVDGTKAMYIVTKAGTVNDKDESYAVDTKGTEPQLNLLDLSTTAAKPIQITTNLDNKVYPRFVANNEIVYISSDDAHVNMSLMHLNADGKELRYFVNHLDVSQVITLKDGTLLVVGESSNYKKSIFKVLPNGSTEKLVALPEGTLDVQMSDFEHIAITVATESGEKVGTLASGKFVDLTH